MFKSFLKGILWFSEATEGANHLSKKKNKNKKGKKNIHLLIYLLQFSSLGLHTATNLHTDHCSKDKRLKLFHYLKWQRFKLYLHHSRARYH